MEESKEVNGATFSNTIASKISMTLASQAPEHKPKKPLSAYIYFS